MMNFLGSSSKIQTKMFKFLETKINLDKSMLNGTKIYKCL